MIWRRWQGLAEHLLTIGVEHRGLVAADEDGVVRREHHIEQLAGGYYSALSGHRGHNLSDEDARLYIYDDLGVSQRWANKFSEAGIETVADLLGHTEEDLLRIEGIGVKAIEELKEGLEARDLMHVIEDDLAASSDDMSQLLDMVFSPDGQVVAAVARKRAVVAAEGARGVEVAVVVQRPILGLGQQILDLAQGSGGGAEGKEPPVGQPLLLGITKASLATDSWMSAASFQETTKAQRGVRVGEAQQVVRVHRTLGELLAHRDLAPVEHARQKLGCRPHRSRRPPRCSPMPPSRARPTTWPA